MRRRPRRRWRRIGHTGCPPLPPTASPAAPRGRAAAPRPGGFTPRLDGVRGLLPPGRTDWLPADAATVADFLTDAAATVRPRATEHAKEGSSAEAAGLGGTRHGGKPGQGVRLRRLDALRPARQHARGIAGRSRTPAGLGVGWRRRDAKSEKTIKYTLSNAAADTPVLRSGPDAGAALLGRAHLRRCQGRMRSDGLKEALVARINQRHERRRGAIASPSALSAGKLPRLGRAPPGRQSGTGEAGRFW